jgi:uncharacterized protein
MIENISKTLQIKSSSVVGCVKLLEEGATIPFIARYRKEATGGLDEVEIAKIRDARLSYIELQKRKDYVKESIKRQDLLSPELEKQIDGISQLSELEDLYLPYKPKRKTRASVAREKGLEPLAKMIMAQNIPDLYFRAEKYVGKNEVSSVEEAIAGAIDIIAEWINERPNIRKHLRYLWTRKAGISATKQAKAEDPQMLYKPFYEYEESLQKAPSHRVLAVLRGENEGILKVKIAVDEEEALESIAQTLIKRDSMCEEEIRLATKESYKRMLFPTLETEFRTQLKERADAAAIQIFADNLRQLLMTSPLGQKVTLALDSGFKSGCKLVILSAQGALLHNETIYPHPPQNESKLARKKLQSLVKIYKVEAIAIGNGTAGRETEQLVQTTEFDRKLSVISVNESGASVYSASALAREEFPDYDVTVRGAVSIGRRLMDPLAEMVKIDPKAIGVGQYQHDVDQKKLQGKLVEEVESVVNAVGVELNTASKELLQYVAGIGPSMAQKLISYRNENGAFNNRNQLLKVPGFGKKAFEQAAGFLRIQHASNVLDNTAVHPESYFVVEKIAKSLKIKVNDLLNQPAVLETINPDDFVDEKAGSYTVRDIITELQKPNRDPRKKIEFFEFDKMVGKISDLKVGMELPGIVTNITAFGAFVDVGVHQDGLLHISEMADRFIKDPHEVVKLNQKVKVRVISLEIERKRIQFSMKNIV